MEAIKREWRCEDCGKLLGARKKDRLHIRTRRGPDYLVGFPVTAVCRGCQSLNELDANEEKAE